MIIIVLFDTIGLLFLLSSAFFHFSYSGYRVKLEFGHFNFETLDFRLIAIFSIPFPFWTSEFFLSEAYYSPSSA